MSPHDEQHRYQAEQGQHGAALLPPRVPSSAPPTYHTPGNVHSMPSLSSTSYSPYGSPSDGHRASSAISSPVSLPSMRSIDPMAQPPPQNMGPGYREDLPVPPILSSTPYPRGHNPSTVLPSSYGISSSDAMARYALPSDPLLLRRQPKKEIKRRTKTGCLTCRKRRIKCDEGHPTCNNCKRSKRVCLGYDPIFRHQPVLVGSANPSRPTPWTPPPSSSAHTSSASSRAPPTPTSYSETGATEGLPHNPHGTSYTPTSNPGPSDPLPPASAAATNPYKTPPSLGRYPSPVPVLASAPCVKPELVEHPSKGAYPTRQPGVKPEPLEPPPVETYSGHQLSDKPEPVDNLSVGTRPDNPQSVKPELVGSPAGTYRDYHRKLLPSIALQSNSPPTSEQGGKMRVEEFISSLGLPPSAPGAIQNEDTYQEVVKVYHEMYAPGLHAFFESTWFYFSENGKMSFPRNSDVVGRMAAFLKVLEGVRVNDHAQMTYSGTLELGLVWALAGMAANAARDAENNRARITLPPENDPVEVKHRFHLVHALLSGEMLRYNPLTPPVQDANHHRMREFEFWYQLGEFLRSHDADSPDPAEVETSREEALNKLRWLLDGRENRDVLYSIAVLRCYGHRFDMSQALQAKYHLPEEVPQNKAVVASKFISAQAQVTGGTTNVVRRICDIASRLYINPGHNVGVAR